MFSFNLEQFSPKNYILTCDFGRSKILTGCFLSEDSIAFELTSKKNEEMEVDTEDVSVSSENFASTFLSDSQINKLKLFSRIDDIFRMISEVDLIVVTSLQELIILPFFFKKFNFNQEKKIITTEPLVQIGKYYLKEFYMSFNKILLQSTGNAHVHSTSDKKFENSEEIFFYINDSDIDKFCESVIPMHYQEKFDLFPHLKVTLLSSGYELGSANILIEYFNQRIGILSKWSGYKYRYPREIDIGSLQNLNHLIMMPDTINYELDYENILTQMSGEIYKITSTVVNTSSHYPMIFMPTNWSFVLDFVDFIKYKIPKEIKNIYISQSIKPIIEYSNVSHAFINSMTHNKIYEFKLPFCFDELAKNEQFYHYRNFEDFLKNFILDSSKSNFNNMSNCPIIFMVNYFSFLFGEAQTIFENFVHNSCPEQDAVIDVNRCCSNYNSLKSQENKYKVSNFYFDTRGNLEQFKVLFFDWIKPQNFHFYEEEAKSYDFVKIILNDSKVAKNSINCENFSLGKDKIIELDTAILSYEKVFFKGREKNEYENFLYGLDDDKSYSMSAERENDSLYIKLKSEINLLKPNKSYLDSFEEDMNSILSLNNMYINEFLNKEDSIKISIVKKSESSANLVSDILIKLGTEPEIEINSESVQDSEFLNRVFQSMFYN
jgi:hypothetical protein